MTTGDVEHSRLPNQFSWDLTDPAANDHSDNLVTVTQARRLYQLHCDAYSVTEHEFFI